MQTVKTLGESLGIAATCSALGLPRATYYRKRSPVYGPNPKRKAPPRTIPAAQREEVFNVLNEARFMDKAPAQVWATLLDEGRYLCSTRTMYRVLTSYGASKERRNQLQPGNYAAPELLATAPNQLWSWDITKLKGPAKWQYFYLYVILDVYSRYVVGWLVADAESKTLATHFIEETYKKQGIVAGQLTLHADRGASMKSKPVAFLLADLGVTKTHSRPQVSNDNPYSESQFKTMKYRPEFPACFGSIADAKANTRTFMRWYNHQHHHSGLGLMTPSDVHHGLSTQRYDARAQVLTAAHALHPQRFVHGIPLPPALQTAAWINKPQKEAASSKTIP